MRTLEAYHRHISFVQPIQITQGSTRIHLKAHIRTVSNMVRRTQLKTTRRGGGVRISRCVRITVNAFNDHRDVRSISWVVPELGDRAARII